jgi:arylsulfatase A-like enzyme
MKTSAEICSLQIPHLSSSVIYLGIITESKFPVLEMADVPHPPPTYQGRPIVHMRGKSLMPFIIGSSPSVHQKDFVSGWETCGRAAVRKEDWKMVFSAYYRLATLRSFLFQVNRIRLRSWIV